MPRITDITGPYRLFFYSFDCNEPAHVHVRRENMVRKFWLEPVELCSNHGFSAHELTTIRNEIRANLVKIISILPRGSHRGSVGDTHIVHAKLLS